MQIPLMLAIYMRRLFALSTAWLMMPAFLRLFRALSHALILFYTSSILPHIE